jgi:hypothetical protein
MSNKTGSIHAQTATVIVIATATTKTPTGKIMSFMQVQKENGGGGFIRCNSIKPPLPGTKIKVTGNIIQTPRGSLLQVMDDKDIQLLTGQQGLILHDTVKTLLDQIGLRYDHSKLSALLLDPKINLIDMTRDAIKNILELSDVKNTELVMDDHGDLFADTLSKMMLDSLERISYPLSIDTKKDIPFIKGTYPSEIMKGCLPNWLTVTTGVEKHPKMRANSRLYIQDIVKWDGIDNFYRALAIASGNDHLFPAWITETKRAGIITSAFLKAKQQEGTQIFTPEDFKALEKIGINKPEQIAANTGGMYKVNGLNVNGIMPMGIYQTASTVATLRKMPQKKIPMTAFSEVDTSFMDPSQKAAFDKFIEGYPVLLVAGPPGTGKSTTISKLIEIAHKNDEQVVVITPTGKAAARLNQSFIEKPPGGQKITSITIHSLFFNQMEGKKLNTYPIDAALNNSSFHMFPTRVDRVVQNTIIKDKKGTVISPKSNESIFSDMVPIPLLTGKTVIIDEASQVSTDLMALILEMRPKKLILTGDPSQLPPMGAGKPFEDLIELARNGKGASNVALAELNIDHRATKELAVSTLNVRQGFLPENKVIAMAENSEINDIVDHLYENEFSILETKSIEQVSDAISGFYEKELTEKNPVFNISYVSNPVIRDDKVNLLLPIEIPTLFAANQMAVPDIMTTAYSNKEVKKLTKKIIEKVRPYTQGGKNTHDILQLSSLTSNDLFPGDIIMQTENNKGAVRYQTPYGNGMHMGTMNGECYLYLGARTWLPTPTDLDTTDIQTTINGLYKKTGLYKTVLNDIQNGKYSDVNYHAALYEQLMNMNQEEAHTLLKMGLVEVVLVDSNIVQGLKLKHGQKYELFSEQIKTIAIIPKIYANKNKGNVQNDDGNRGLIRYWNIEIQAPRTNPINEKESYNLLADELSKNLANFTSGYAFTTHKSQGSQSNTAICVLSAPAREDDAKNHEKAGYTGLTRAQSRGIIIVNEKTTAEVNSIWQKTRDREKIKTSAIQAIATGMIAPLNDTLSIQSVYLPSDKVFAEIGSNEHARAREIYKRGLKSSIGLPGGIDLTSDKNPLFELAYNSINTTKPDNNIVIFPNVGVIKDSNVTKDIFDKKPIINEPDTSKAINDELSLMDICFEIEGFN